MASVQNEDRTVHAMVSLGDRSGNQRCEVVRYDRQGRWYSEYVTDGGRIASRARIGSVKQAASEAVDMERSGGTIYLGLPGGGRFDGMIEGARQKQGRRG